MLVLTRKEQERIHIGDQITVTIVRIKGHTVRVGIKAPENMRILRGELAAAIAEFRDPDDHELASDESSAGEGEFAAGEFAASNDAHTEEAAETEDDTFLCELQLAPSRTPGVSRAPLVRRPVRLGPASLRKLSCR